MRWKLRSAPERSTRSVTPGYFASKALATFSASTRSTEVYQVTLPSFFAVSTSAGVIFSASGAACAEVMNDPAIPRRRGGRHQYPPPAELARHVLAPSVSARQRSAGRRSHTSAPGAISRSAAAVTLISVLSSSRTV